MSETSLPSGWSRVLLGDVAAFVMGQAPPGTECNTDGRGTPFVKAGEFGALRPIIREWTTQPLKMASSTDVLICVVGATAGKLNLGADCAIGRSVAAIRPRPALDQRFLYLQLLPKVLELRANSVGSAQGVISSKDLYAIETVLPPLTEQHRIVAALEEHLSDLDAAVAGLERSKTSVKRLTSSILVAAAYGRLCEDQRARAVEPRVAGHTTLPDGWQWVTVDTVGDVLLGRQRAPQYLTGKYSKPYLRVANVGDDVLDVSDIKEMDFDPVHAKKYALEPGDIVVSEGQSPELVGQSAIYRGGVSGLCFQKTLHRFRADPNRVLPEFAQIVFRAFVRSGDFQRHASLTVNIAHLTLERFKAVPFPLPPLETQHIIVEDVERRLSAAERIAADIDVQLTRAGRLRQSILKRAFEGKLVPRNPNDEMVPALAPCGAGRTTSTQNQRA